METFKKLMRDDFGYETKTTFWEDFSIAERFGASAVKETYKRAFEEWKNNHIYLTELVLVLNHKIWYYYERNEPLARVYSGLWETANNYGINHLKGDELAYFFRTLD